VRSVNLPTGTWRTAREVRAEREKLGATLRGAPRAEPDEHEQLRLVWALLSVLLGEYEELADEDCLLIARTSRLLRTQCDGAMRRVTAAQRCAFEDSALADQASFDRWLQGDP